MEWDNLIELILNSIQIIGVFIAIIIGLIISKVMDLKKEKNEVIVGEKDYIYKSEMIVKNINLLLVDKILKPMKVTVKTRYSSMQESAIIEQIDDDTIQVNFDNPVARITPRTICCILFR